MTQSWISLIDFYVERMHKLTSGVSGHALVELHLGCEGKTLACPGNPLRNCDFGPCLHSAAHYA